MLETFTALLTAHLLADFVLQTDYMIAHKKQAKILALHGLIIGIATMVAIGGCTKVSIMMTMIVVITHILMDFIKLRYLGDTLRSFALDQGVHIAVIAAITAWYPELSSMGWWAGLAGHYQAQLYAGMTLASGIIIGVPLGGVLIKKLVAPIAPPPPSSTGSGTGPLTGMAQGGKYIGWLERAITMMLILTGKAEGVGFLIAAKSILRLRDISTDEDRHVAEYIIIGTFLSFGWGMLVALMTAKAVSYWSAF
ncbi:MAG TPA: hypothetical protein DCL34_12750 [Erythrobacter sp.]|nr:hypothetical protein [Erythrobacter sp.]|tara:strand:+ start:1555 stop:2310 length:756 start_codon:yes stop_codon:yes gene_type:complete